MQEGLKEEITQQQKNNPRKFSSPEKHRATQSDVETVNKYP